MELEELRNTKAEVLCRYMSGETACRFNSHIDAEFVGGLRKRVSDRTGVPRSELRLLHKEAELLDHELMKDVSVDKGVMLITVVRVGQHQPADQTEALVFDRPESHLLTPSLDWSLHHCRAHQCPVYYNEDGEKYYTLSAEQLKPHVDQLFDAATAGHSERARHFIRMFGQLDSGHAAISSALWAAAYFGREEVVLTLLQGNADPSWQNGNKDTALHAAAEAGHYRCVEALLSYGSSLETANYQGATPLHRAVFNGELEAARQLIARKAKLEATTNAEGFTSLIIAAVGGHKEIAMALLDSRANPNAESYFGYKAWMHARLNKHGELADMLHVRTKTHTDA